MAEGSEKSTKSQSEDKKVCANHPDREATFTSDDPAFEEVNLCDECVPAHWR